MNSSLSTNVIWKLLFVSISLLCFTPWVNPPIALFAGVVLSLVIGNPYSSQVQNVSKYLLQLAVVGLGFGVNLTSALAGGAPRLEFIIGSAVLTILLGLLVGKLLGIDKKIVLLLSSGTAICGGSAIAAVSPVIEAKEHHISVALGTVFVLNAIALFIFPFIGEYFNLSQIDFGLWAALAIHDTSSVVGAAQVYGEEALEIATVTKLTRALLIFPLVIIISFFYKNGEKKTKIPWFIIGFIGAMLINTYVEQLAEINQQIAIVAKKALTLTLFLIGTGLTRELLRNVGLRPMILGLLLWIVISIGSLATILYIY
ncbi:MAG: putative sulfate exporter family transporter [Bacteroidetes bacterium]|nr:MAG: putative sulfate exporter family transporter [Bacteroidota bacterium]